MRFVTVRVEKAPESHATISVAPWEVPILQMIHRDVIELGEVQVDREYPDAVSEYQRLSQRYGFDVENSETPYVTLIYGHGPAKLAQVIEFEAAQAAKPKQAKKGGAVPIES